MHSDLEIFMINGRSIKNSTSCSFTDNLLPAAAANSPNNNTEEGHMDNFQAIAEQMIAEMEKHAKELGVRGVMLVASMDENGFSWVSHMKAVDAIAVAAEGPGPHEYPGHNFIAIAYSKAAEMADTKLTSGSKVRPAYKGEFGFQGGEIIKTTMGYVLAVFSGATGEQDFEISQAGIKAYEAGR